MPKRLTIEPHLSVKELEIRYRQAKEPKTRLLCWKGLLTEIGLNELAGKPILD